MLMSQAGIPEGSTQRRVNHLNTSRKNTRPLRHLFAFFMTTALEKLDSVLATTSSLANPVTLDQWTPEMVAEWLENTNSRGWASLFIGTCPRAKTLANHKDERISGDKLNVTLADLANPPFNVTTLGKRMQLFHDLLTLRKSQASMTGKLDLSRSFSTKKQWPVGKYGTHMSKSSSGSLFHSTESLEEQCAQLLTKVESLCIHDAPQNHSEFTLGYYLQDVEQDTMNSFAAQPAWTPRPNSMAFSFQDSVQHSETASRASNRSIGNMDTNNNDSTVTLANKEQKWVDAVLQKIKRPSNGPVISSPRTLLNMTPGTIVKQGWLWCKSDLPNDAWKRMWCVLQQGSCWFVRSQTEPVIQGCVPLAQKYQLEPILTKTSGLKTRYAFKTTHASARNYTFCSDTQLDCMLWAKEMVKMTLKQA